MTKPLVQQKRTEKKETPRRKKTVGENSPFHTLSVLDTELAVKRKNPRSQLLTGKIKTQKQLKLQ